MLLFLRVGPRVCVIYSVAELDYSSADIDNQGAGRGVGRRDNQGWSEGEKRQLDRVGLGLLFAWKGADSVSYRHSMVRKS